jgi:threonine dehydratase
MGLTISDIERAAERLHPHLRRTPVLTVAGDDVGADATVTVAVKLELLQHSGSFKARGATNFLLTNEIGPAGVVAASGGNHGAAVAWAAQCLGHRATIFVPTIAAPAKVERLRAYGAVVHQVGGVYADALAASRELQARSGAVAVHAYDDDTVMAGAGTTGRELDHQVDGLDAVVVACGGGGLAGGTAAWFGRRAEIVVCETEGTPSYARAREAGRPVDVPVSGIAADALGASRLGTGGWSQLSAVDATSVVVTDGDVVAARHLLWDRFRLVTEPSAAVPVAALLSGRYRPTAGAAVGVVICGANTDPGSVIS